MIVTAELIVKKAREQAEREGVEHLDVFTFDELLIRDEEIRKAQKIVDEHGDFDVSISVLEGGLQSNGTVDNWPGVPHPEICVDTIDLP